METYLKKIVPGMFIFFGIIMIIGGINRGSEYSRLSKDGYKSYAKVARIDRVKSGKKWVDAYFVDYNYDSIEYKNVKIVLGAKGANIGDSIEIYVDKKNPKNIMPTYKTSSGVGGGTLAVGGFLFAVLGLIFYRNMNRM